LKELVALDPSKRGMLQIQAFVNFISNTGPKHIKFSSTDLQFLAMKYVN
jgi:hypothetical protein